MDQVPISKWAPKFGNINNSEPAVQGEVTINTYLRAGEFQHRNFYVASESGDRIVFPYGKDMSDKHVQGVDEHEVALLVREEREDYTGKEGGKKRYREGAVRPKGARVDNYPLVLTSLNGVNVKGSIAGFDEYFWKLPAEVRKAYIRQQFCPIGVIGTPNLLDSEDNRYTFPYFPTRIAGVFSMQNGPYDIHAGDYLMVDVPEPKKDQNDKVQSYKRSAEADKYSRLPSNKVTMELIPVKHGEMASFTALEEFMESKNDEQIEDWINKMVPGFAQMTEVEKLNAVEKLPTCAEQFLLTNLVLLVAFQGARGVRQTFDTHKRLLQMLYKSYFNVRTEISERVVGRGLHHIKKWAEGDVYVGKGYFV